MTVKLAPIDLSAEVESYSRPEPGQEFWQQSGFTFVGSSDGMDFLLWTRICIISGREGGQWLHTGQTIEHATTLIMVPSERRGELTDHTLHLQRCSGGTTACSLGSHHHRGRRGSRVVDWRSRLRGDSGEVAHPR